MDATAEPEAKRARLGATGDDPSLSDAGEDAYAEMATAAVEALHESDHEETRVISGEDAARTAEDEALLESLVDDGFAITLGGLVPVPSVTPTQPPQPSLQAGAAAPGASGDEAAAPPPKKEVQALRFSGPTPSLQLRTTTEQEEALRTMGVTPQNYAAKMNPQGFVPGRRPNAFEIQMETLDHPKWLDPGSIQSDFFNYGLQETTWREYAARQVALRLFRLQKAKEAAPTVNDGAGGEAEKV